MKQSPHRNDCSRNLVRKNLCVAGAPPKKSGTSHYFNKTKAACDVCSRKDLEISTITKENDFLKVELERLTAIVEQGNFIVIYKYIRESFST